MVTQIANLEKPARKLATIRRIKALDPISGADAIEAATVDGWKVVVKRGEFSVGDVVVYLEIDSWVPHSLAPFLSKGKEPRVYKGIPGEKLRTVSLKGQVSQGLVLPSDILKQFGVIAGADVLPGYDVTELLGIVKWEAAIPAELVGQVKGLFPSFIRKTDQERCQNLSYEIFAENANACYEVSIKLDGTSCTIYHCNGELGVCSRNLELKVNDENKNNTLIRQLFDNLFNISLPAIGRNLALQGELMGPGIQKNREQLKNATFFIFDIFDIDRGEYVDPIERDKIVRELRNTFPLVDHVPVLHENISLEELGIRDVAGLLAFAEGPSLNHPVREGLVFKRLDGGFSFKAIANNFLMKEKD